MTPIQLIADECANHQPDGSCLGMIINPDLSITRGHALPRCLVADGKRCPYFEECVAPMADMATDPRRSRQLKEPVGIYLMQHRHASATGRCCPECGLPIEPRKRLCRSCADQRRKATFRAAYSRRTQPEVMPSTVNAKTTPKNPMIQGGILPDFQNAIEDSHPPQNDYSTVEAGDSTAIPPKEPSR